MQGIDDNDSGQNHDHHQHDNPHMIIIIEILIYDDYLQGPACMP